MRRIRVENKINSKHFSVIIWIKDGEGRIGRKRRGEEGK